MRWLPLCALLCGCLAAYDHDATPHVGPTLDTLALFADDRPTGVVETADGRLFVSFPRWWDVPRHAVSEILPGDRRPWPDPWWNAWDGEEASADSALVCVQSLTLDERGELWLLDPANPGLQLGTIPGGPKLVAVDARGRVTRVLPIGPEAAPENSYLNDVRIFEGRAYITDSGTGALVVVELATGEARRLLAAHPALQADADTVPRVGGVAWTAFGSAPRVHADGIALDRRRRILYVHALTAPTLYAIPLDRLGPEVPTESLGAAVRPVLDTGPVDGLACDDAGRVYWTAIERDAIERLLPDGRVDTVVRHPEIRWPDAIAIAPDGRSLCFTTSQIHLDWPFNFFRDRRTEPFGLYRVPVRFPVRRELLGESVEGRPLLALHCGDGPRSVLAIAGIHGSEPAGVALLESLADSLACGQLLGDSLTVTIVARANPDGLAAGKRGNARGVDLNRDFPAANRRDPPLTEPESVALHALIERLRPARILSIHQPLACVDHDGPGAELAAAMATVCPLPARKLGGRPGSLGSWAEELGIPAITLELLPGEEELSAAALQARYGAALEVFVRGR